MLARRLPTSHDGEVNLLQFFMLCMAGCINRNQQNAIEYLQEEVTVLKEQLGKKPRFNDDQRRRLAAKAWKIGLQRLQGIAAIATPRTLLVWHQRLAERLVRSIKESCLDQMVLIGEASLHRATLQFVLHYHHERNHQGLGNKIIQPEFAEFPAEGAINCRERLGGPLRWYYREAAGESRAREFPDSTRRSLVPPITA